MGAIQRYRQSRAVRQRNKSSSELEQGIKFALRGTSLATKILKISTPPNETYKVVGDPRVVFNLQRMPDGTLAAWARDGTGRFIGQARLKPVMHTARYAKAASAAALIIALNEVERRLRSIDQRLDRIEVMLRDDATKRGQQALAFAVEAIDRRDDLSMRLAELPLRQCLAQHLMRLIRDIDAIPQMETGLTGRFTNWWNENRSRIIEGTLGLQTQLQDLFVGFQVLHRLKLQLDGQAAASRCTESFDLNLFEQGLITADQRIKTIEDVRQKTENDTELSYLAELRAPWLRANETLKKIRATERASFTDLLGQDTAVVIKLQDLRSALA